MSYDLGDPVSLAIEVKDSAGVLANAGAVTLTVTQPDGTTLAATVTNPSTGRYAATVTPVQAGRHTARWVATGANASAFSDAFDVREATPRYIVSLADARSHLHLTPTNTGGDDELRRYIEAAGEVIEDMVGAVVVRSVVEKHDAGTCLVLRTTPVLSLTSVVPWGTTGTSYAVADLRVSEFGIVERKDGGRFDGGPFEVTFKAGRTVIPAAITEAALELVRINFRSYTGEQDFRYDRDDAEYQPESRSDLGFFIPSGIVSLLRPHMISGIA